MGRSKKLTECWDEILRLWTGGGALRLVIYIDGEHGCGDVAGVTRLIFSHSKPKMLWSLLLGGFPRIPFPGTS